MRTLSQCKEATTVTLTEAQPAVHGATTTTQTTLLRHSSSSLGNGNGADVKEEENECLLRRPKCEGVSRMSAEFEERFAQSWEEISPNGETAIKQSEVKRALDLAGYRLPNHRVRELLADLKKRGQISGDQDISKEVFKEICRKEKLADNTQDWKADNRQSLAVKKEAQSHLGYGYHVVTKEEQRSIANWINSCFLGDQGHGMAHILPLSDDGSDLYSKVGDGILFCRIINLAVPDTIDERAVNQGAKLSVFKKHENLTVAINSAQAIGCTVVNMDSHSMMEGTEHLVLGLLWQIIYRFLFRNINLEHVPGLVALLREDETIQDLLKMSPEEILLRWVNYQLEKAGSDQRVKNFGKDISDSVAYTHLIHQISPKESGVHKNALNKSDLMERAEETLEQADKIGCRDFVRANDIVNGFEKLNLPFVASLFNKYPALDEPEDLPELPDLLGTREERMYMNWMNSLGVNPQVNWLYSDLTDGRILFQIYEIIQPGIVDWKKVSGTESRPFSKMGAKRNLQVLANCNYAIELGRKLGFVLVGIEGNDIMTGVKTLTLGLVWQLMRAYTLSLLRKLSPDGSPIVETEIIEWANQRLKEGGRGVTIRHFQDKANKTALPVINLIDAMRSGVVNYDIVNPAPVTDADLFSNAKYAITLARMIDAPVYALPEDLTEVKHKMVMTVYASLMLVDMK